MQVEHSFSRWFERLSEAGIRVSLFIEPEIAQMEAAVSVGAPVVELHTGSYCNADGTERQKEFERIVNAAAYADRLGLECHAGHGLSFDTVAPISTIPELVELNIGHFLIGEAIFGGLESAIRRIRALMDNATPFGSGRAKRLTGVRTMIIGIGSDLVDMNRIDKTLERFGDRFTHRCFTEIERRKSDRRRLKAASYARRFAAKEACAKALGTGFRTRRILARPGGRQSGGWTTGYGVDRWRARTTAGTDPGRHVGDDPPHDNRRTTACSGAGCHFGRTGNRGLNAGRVGV